MDLYIHKGTRPVSTPDGLILVGLGIDEPVPTSDGAEILWDSADEAV